MHTVLVDGYNVAYKLGVRVSSQNLALVREQVELLLLAYHAHRKSRIVVIYDGQGSIGSWQKHGPLEIEFAPKRQTADARIKELIDEARSKARISVVSSDHSVQHYAKVSGVTYISAEAFLSEIRTKTQLNNNFQEKHSKAKRGVAEKPNTLSEKELSEWLKIFGD
jgi:predicted RNA-binding protein with PIN domain